MKVKTQAKKSRILDAVHETARELQEAGFIDMRRMRQYDVDRKSTRLNSSHT